MKTNYRKQKKVLKIALKEAERMWDEHPLSNSAKSLVRIINQELKALKEKKHESLGSY